MTLRSALSLLIVVLPGFAAADSMRCGKWVVNEELAPAEILAKCGEPQTRNVEENEVLARNSAGHTYRAGTQTVERWVYKRSPGALPMQVTIVDGKVTEIRRISD
jgi:hypothetical protein